MATFQKRGNYWRAQIRNKQYPPQSRTFDTKAQAETWARSIEAEMDRGIFLDHSEAERTTLKEALERYWIEISSQKRHPYQEHRRILRWQAHPLALRSLATLRGVDFATYRDVRLAEGKATNTVRLELALMGHLFEICRKEWGMESLLNPLKNIRKPAGSRERDRRLLPGEYEKIHAALLECGNPWVAPVFQFAIETSLRQGMLFVLRWEWVDLNRQVVLIPAEYRGTGNKGVPPAIPLSRTAVAIIRQLPRSVCGHLFPTTQNAVVMAWKKTRIKLGLEDLRWHDLRHEAASRFFECGLNPLEVAAITGHRNLNTLRRYTHLNPQDLAKKLG